MPVPKTQVTLHADLAAFVRDMCITNGLTLQGYANHLLEKGICQDLKNHGYTQPSIDTFLHDLRLHKQCNWSLLVRKRE